MSNQQRFWDHPYPYFAVTTTIVMVVVMAYGLRICDLMERLDRVEKRIGIQQEAQP